MSHCGQCLHAYHTVVNVCRVGTRTHKSVATADGALVSWVFPGLNRFEPVLMHSTRVAREQLDLLTFRPRDVYGKFHDFVRTFQKAAVTLTFAKRYTSKSSRYNATMQYSSYSLHARLRFSRWMHVLSSARFQSASWVKRRVFVRTFQKAAVFVLLTRTL